MRSPPSHGPYARCLVALAFGAMLGSSSAARAADEPVRLLYMAPPGCASEAELRERIAASGGELGAQLPEIPARAFVVTIDNGPPFVGRLVVRDLFGRETQRTVSSASCDDVTRSLALFVTLALDAARYEHLPPAPVLHARPPREEPSPDVAPAARDPWEDAGGIAASAFALGGSDGGGLAGARVLTLSRPLGELRYGGALALSRANRVAPDPVDPTSLTGIDGNALQAGAVVALGGPWSDAGIGLAAELGMLLAQEKRRMVSGPLVTAQSASAYVCAALRFHLTLTGPVRPFIGFDAMWVPTYYADSRVFLGVEAGLAWRAW